MVPGDELSGLLVIDARPGVPIANDSAPDEKVLGALVPDLDVFWAEIKHEEFVRHDPVQDVDILSPPKIYLSVVNDDDTIKGLWVRP
ncbi:MAG: hypothetical protein KJ645_10955, partial [Planctomycetes bacterium]|nr:hypothetical protein [Planctomycetota bacterium]